MMRVKSSLSPTLADAAQQDRSEREGHAKKDRRRQLRASGAELRAKTDRKKQGKESNTWSLGSLGTLGEEQAGGQRVVRREWSR